MATRVSLSGIEDFKRERKQQAATKEELPRNSPTETLEEPQPPGLPEGVDVETSEVSAAEVLQSELGLNEPPPETSVTSPKGYVSLHDLHTWWIEFSDTQSVRVSSFLKSIEPTSERNEVRVMIPKGKMEIMETVKFTFPRFISEKTGGILDKLTITEGEPEMNIRKPYTDKEKLEYLIGKHPEIEDVVKRLRLFIP